MGEKLATFVLEPWFTYLLYVYTKEIIEVQSNLLKEKYWYQLFCPRFVLECNIHASIYYITQGYTVLVKILQIDS